MKRIATLTAVLLASLASLASADHFETLAGYGDSVTIPAGKAALVLFVAQTPTVQYDKQGRRPVQFRLGHTRRSERFGGDHYAYRPQVEKNPSAQQPLALAGPATVSLRSPGLVSLRIVGPAEAE